MLGHAEKHQSQVILRKEEFREEQTPNQLKERTLHIKFSELRWLRISYDIPGICVAAAVRTSASESCKPRTKAEIISSRMMSLPTAFDSCIDC